MGKSIRLNVNGENFTVELYDCDSADAFAAALPLSAHLSRWGDEYYGSISADIVEDDSARTEMEIGEIAYWAPGQALCIFFGPTPASIGNEPRAASDVVPLGHIQEDISSLKGMGDSVNVTIE